MKLALIYIATIIIVYVMVDVILYMLSREGPRALLNLLRNALHASEAEDALTKTRTFHEAVVKWIDTDRRLEYKSVYVGNNLALNLENLATKWKDAWPEDFVSELKQTAAKLRAYYPRYMWALFKAIAIAIVLALFIRAFLVQAFKIPSGSMIPTLYVGDQLLVNKFKYGIENPFTGNRIITFREPRRGDVVVFRPPRSVESSWLTHEIRFPGSAQALYSWRSQVDFIKRVVGLPGDKIETRDGYLYINDQKLPVRPLNEFDYQKKYGSYVRTVETEAYEETIDGKNHLVIHDRPLPAMGDNFGPYVVPPGCFFAMGDNRDDSADARTWTDDPARLNDIRGKAFIIHFSWDPVENRPRFGRIGKLIH